jgi:S-DNA-T family DNA segregation ATPase FtsK/SpoIIIE
VTEQDAVTIALQHKMTSLGLNVKPSEAPTPGPIITAYRFTPLGATKVAHIEALSEDFAVTLGVEDVFVKRMPGETSVGIFVPNKERKYVFWRDICININDVTPIPLLLGIDYLGHRQIVDLALLPHLLIAGSTGSGKSTLLSSLIATLILARPEVRFYMSDTKGVEFNHFADTPQLLAPIATTVSRTIEILDQAITEMERRLKLYAEHGHRNILEYNSTNTSTLRRLPYIVIIIDEVADLLGDTTRIEQDEGRSITLGKISSGKLSKLAQKARATGIHVIASTQRPSVRLMEGDIKANFPARITFRLPSEPDSRTVLGQGGAEHLLSRGDMLFLNPNRPGLHRIHAPMASISDIQAAVAYAERR